MTDDEQAVAPADRIVAAATAVLIAAALAASLAGIAGLTGGRALLVGDALALASARLPVALVPAIAFTALALLALLAARLTPRAADSPLSGAAAMTLAIIGAVTVWSFAWTALRLVFDGGLPQAPFLPIHIALLVLAASVVPGTVLVLPAALLWAWTVSAVVEPARDAA